MQVYEKARITLTKESFMMISGGHVITRDKCFLYGLSLFKTDLNLVLAKGEYVIQCLTIVFIAFSQHFEFFKLKQKILWPSYVPSHQVGSLSFVVDNQF